MSKCVRAGRVYKRHKWAPNLSSEGKRWCLMCDRGLTMEESGWLHMPTRGLRILDKNLKVVSDERYV